MISNLLRRDFEFINHRMFEERTVRQVFASVVHNWVHSDDDR